MCECIGVYSDSCSGDCQGACEPRPRVVPNDPPPPLDDSGAVSGLVVVPQRLVLGPLGHKWMRGIGYERLRRELADGHYPDE